MKFFINIFKIITLSVLIAFLHYAASFLLPPPFNYINVIFVFIIISIIGWESGISIWLAFLLHFFIELYSITHFGLVLLPSVVATFVVYILHLFVFTNRSWYSVLALSSIAIIVYRFLYTFLFVVIGYYSSSLNFSWKAIFLPYIWELILTSILSCIIVFLLSKILHQFKSEKIVI
jgi:hypothetical protein